MNFKMQSKRENKIMDKTENDRETDSDRGDGREARFRDTDRDSILQEQKK